MDNRMVFSEEKGDLNEEIDDLSYISSLSKVDAIDPFSEIKVSSLSPKMKRKAQRVATRNTRPSTLLK